MNLVAHAFDARQSDVIQYGDMTGPIDTHGHSVAVAFDLRGREGGSQFEGAHDTANIRAASGGSSRSYVAAHESGPGWWNQDDIAGTLRAEGENRPSRPSNVIASQWGVRRLTPRECERLQGFPEIRETCTVIAWNSSDRRAPNAPAEISNLRSQPFALSADGSALSPSVDTAGLGSSTHHRDPDLPVVLHVLIDLERQAVEIHRTGKLIWSARDAERPSASPLSMPIDGFVRLVAHMTTIAGSKTQAGAEASRPSTNVSSVRPNGNGCVSTSGREIDALAKDASLFTETVNACLKSTTSLSGLNSQICGLSLQTFVSCAVAAILGCIPSEMRQGNSFAVTFETTRGYTAIPYRGKPAADGPRYKALGNSMAVNVMRWIGRRIEMVQSLCETV